MAAHLYALCLCTDGQHGEPDRESWRTDRGEVERGVFFYGRDAVHLVQSVQVVTAVEFTSAVAAYRRTVLAEFADTAFRLPADVEQACQHRPEDVCERCASVVTGAGAA